MLKTKKVNMQQLIICRGLPASGKSTFSKAWVLEDPEHRIRVCRDDIRKMLGKYWVPSREDLVTNIERTSVISALQHGYSVILDATNFKHQTWIKFHELYKPNELELTIQNFTDIPLETCIERDKLRTGDDHVGEEVIRNMYNKYLKK